MPFTSASISITPTMMAETIDGNIAMIDGCNPTVTIVTPQGATVSTISLSFLPSYIAIDTHGTGDMYFSVPSELRIYRTDSTGNVTITGPQSEVQLGSIAVSPNGTTIYVFVGYYIYALDSGTLNVANISFYVVAPSALCADSDNLYVATAGGVVIILLSNNNQTLLPNAIGNNIAISNGDIYVSNGVSLMKVHVDNTITTISNGGWKAGALLGLSSGKLVVANCEGTSFYVSTGSIDNHTVVPCFLADAPVLTPAGYAPISSLSAGDKVVTGDGRAVAIQRVSHTQVAAGPSVHPYVIPKGLHGATQKLLISPDHRVSTANGLLEARLLGLEQENMTGAIDYYNLELPSWSQDTMVVAGVIVESLAPVRRVTMTLAQFKKALVAQYGEITPAILTKVQKTCRMLAGGRVECPVLRK